VTALHVITIALTEADNFAMFSKSCAGVRCGCSGNDPQLGQNRSFGPIRPGRMRILIKCIHICKFDIRVPIRKLLERIEQNL
jgi:hypothetical protein